MRLAVPLALAIAAGTARAESPAPPPVRQVDLLIVVDASPDAAGLRAAFTAGLPAFTDQLMAAFPGDYAAGSLDLHVGVITSDASDGGRLRTASRSDCAAAPSDAYVAYRADQWGEHAHNFTGTLAAAIACLAPTTAGSDLNQSLATITHALDGSVAANAGFRRPGATLAVLVVAGQDDCTDHVGGLATFTCAQAHWACNPALDQSGAHTCHALWAGAPTDFLSFLETQVLALPQVALGVWRGTDAQPVASSGTTLAPTCTRGAVHPTPALRLDAIAAALPNGWRGDACTADGYGAFASTIAAAIYTPVGSDDYHGDCDGGLGDPYQGHPVDGCGCSSGAPSSGTALVLLLALTRSFPSRRCRARRARAAG